MVSPFILYAFKVYSSCSLTSFGEITIRKSSYWDKSPQSGIYIFNNGSDLEMESSKLSKKDWVTALCALEYRDLSMFCGTNRDWYNLSISLDDLVVPCLKFETRKS